VKYKTERVLLEKEINDARTSEADRIRLRAEAIALDDKFDKPYVVDGKEVMPSILRVAFTDLDPLTQESHKAAAVLRPWGQLSKFDKDILGAKTSDVVQEGWAEFHRVESRYKADNPGKSLSKFQRLDLAKQIEAHDTPGFVKDFEFAQKSLAERFVSLDAYKKSKNKSDWDEVLGKAKLLVDAVNNKVVKSESAKAAWKDWVTGVYRTAQRVSPEFYSELLRYDKILYKLVG